MEFFFCSQGGGFLSRIFVESTHMVMIFRAFVCVFCHFYFLVILSLFACLFNPKYVSIEFTFYKFLSNYITCCQVESFLFLGSKFGKQESQLTSKLHVTCVEMSWLKFSCITSSRTLLTSYERQHCRSTSALWS